MEAYEYRIIVEKQVDMMEINRCVNCMEELTGTICEKCGFDNSQNTQVVTGLQWNTLLKGRYLVGKILGQGGFGITYIGFDMLLNIKVAIKEYFPMGQVIRDNSVSNQIIWTSADCAKDQRQNGSESFLKEARKMVKIDQIPEIVRVRDIFFENQTAYIVMDFIEGKTLKATLLKNGTMKYSECMRLFQPLIEAMAKVHKQGLIHRDISPDNIMLQPDGSVRILDLGAAKDITTANKAATQMVAKKGFSPAEQYMDSGVIGTWTDVYAMCATIYYCLIGKAVPDAMERLLQDNLSFEFPMKEVLPAGVEETLRAGLALRVEERIQTMEELGERLFNGSSEEELRNQEEELKSREEEKRKQEEEQKRLEEERRNQEEELKRREEEKRRQEEEQKRLEEERRKQEGDRRQQEEKIKKKQSMKKLGVLGVIVGCFLLFAITSDTESPVIYEINNGEVTVTGYNGELNLTEIVIPETIEGCPVKKIGVGAFGYCTNLTYVDLPASLEIIGDNAFNWCESLTEIELPEGVKEIGYSAFNECSKLTYVDLPKSLEIIRDDAFAGCEGLTEIQLPEGVKEIGKYAFRYCTKLTYVDLPKSLEIIGESAFGGCKSLTEIQLPEGVKEIGKSAFVYCTNLTYVGLPESLEIIGEAAFYDCESLTEIELPEGVKKICNRAFAQCDNLVEITVSRDCEIHYLALPEGVTINYYD